MCAINGRTPMAKSSSRKEEEDQAAAEATWKTSTKKNPMTSLSLSFSLSIVVKQLADGKVSHGGQVQ